MKPNMDRLAELFGSSAEVARAAGVTRSAVARWGRYQIAPSYQEKLVEEGKARGISAIAIAEAAGVPQCPVCGAFHYEAQ